MRLLGLSILATLCAASMAFGNHHAGHSHAVKSTSPFQNHLRSQMMVSPAQIYQTAHLKTDFQLGFSSDEGTSEPDGGTETTATNSLTDVYAAGVYAFEGTGVILALEAMYGTGTTELEGTIDAENDGSQWEFIPQVAYSAGPVVLGLGVRLAGTTTETDPEDLEGSYVQYIPGVTFAQNNFEVGVAFTTEAQEKAEKSDEVDVNEEAVVAIHGRYAVNPELAVGAILENRHFKGINEDTNDDQISIRGTAEYTQPVWRIEGDVAFNTSFYKEDANISSENIATFEIGTAADYKVTPQAAIGGLVRYEFGSDDNAGTDYAVSNFDVGVRGNWTF